MILPRTGSFNGQSRKTRHCSASVKQPAIFLASYCIKYLPLFDTSKTSKVQKSTGQYDLDHFESYIIFDLDGIKKGSGHNVRRAIVALKLFHFPAGSI